MATVTKPRPKFTQSTGGCVRVSDWIRGDAARVNTDCYPRARKRYTHPSLTETALSRARHGGGPLAGVGMMWLGSWQAGDGPEAADRMLAYLHSLREMLWGEPEPDVGSLFVAEGEHDGLNGAAETRYLLQPGPDTGIALFESDVSEAALHLGRAAAMQRRWRMESHS